MRIPRFAILLGIVAGLPQASHASWIAHLIYSFHERSAAATLPTTKPKAAGQDTRAFKLNKANAKDVANPVQHFLDGISKAGGSVQIRESDNALIVTDTPENLARLAALMPQIDQPYDNSNAMARQMLVTQNLMKAIRAHRGEYATASARPALSGASNGPRMPAAATPPPTGVLGVVTPLPMMPAYVFPRHRDADDMLPNPKPRWAETPSLGQFEIVGWMKDEYDGYVIVLKNEDRRFVYHHGRLHGGYNPRGQVIAGVSGSIENQRLILKDFRKGTVTLPIMKWHDL